MTQIYTFENVEIKKIVDGDTVDALVDLGFNTWKLIRIRLLGINAPESRTQDLEEKKLGLRSKKYLDSIMPAGTFVKLECHGKGKYGRWLGVLHRNGININEHMVENGYAKYVTY